MKSNRHLVRRLFFVFFSEESHICIIGIINRSGACTRNERHDCRNTNERIFEEQFHDSCHLSAQALLRMTVQKICKSTQSQSAGCLLIQTARRPTIWERWHRRQFRHRPTCQLPDRHILHHYTAIPQVWQWRPATIHWDCRFLYVYDCSIPCVIT